MKGQVSKQEQVSQQMANQINQINFAYNSSPEKIVPVGITTKQPSNKGHQIMIPDNMHGHFTLHQIKDNQYVVT